MSTVAVFIDLPNLFGNLIRSKLGEAKFLRAYFLEWLDLDLLISHTTFSSSDIWVFYSKDRIGPADAKITGQVFLDYIDRVNRLSGVTARDVNIPGTQRETISVECTSCGQKVQTDSKSEKGIDASLIVHLFDTMDYWETAYLLSGDADFVPAVAALRRRGKIVIGAGFSQVSSALVRECYSYTNLVDRYFLTDIALYAAFREDGIIEQFLSNIQPEVSNSPTSLVIEIIWAESVGLDGSNIHIKIQGSCYSDDFSRDLMTYFGHSRMQIREFPEKQEKNFFLLASSIHLQGLVRRSENLLKSIQEIQVIRGALGQTKGYRIKYEYNTDHGRYEPLKQSPDALYL